MLYMIADSTQCKGADMSNDISAHFLPLARPTRPHDTRHPVKAPRIKRNGRWRAFRRGGRVKATP